MTEVVLPKLGESILSATVVRWLKKEGDMVSEDDPLVEVATDKVNSEIPSPISGRLQKILVPVDKEIDIGTPLAIVEQDGVKQSIPMPEHEASVAEHEVLEPSSSFLSPAVLRLAQERGLSLDQISHIKGTGRAGRVTRRDVENFSLAGGNAPSSGEVERVPMTPMRKAIAENMTRSFYTAPHAYLVAEVDVTDLRAKIKGEREAHLKEHGVKLTLTPFLIQALARALQAHPLLNATLQNDEIHMKRYVNVGVAVAVGDGLLVPVIKGCQEKEISTLAKELTDLSTRARSGNLQPDEVRDGTVTLTNFGMSGALLGLPIIRFPEVAIVGFGAIKREFVVGPDDKPVIREIIRATLSFDHRAVDGMYAAAFLGSLQEALESV
jgi:2-oxoglutarate dehydrogenase E2 component (dihydrolipoamide succinyltransferase)